MRGEWREVREAAMQICDVFQTGSPERKTAVQKESVSGVGEEELEGGDWGKGSTGEKGES